MKILVPFNFGQIPVQEQLAKYLWMYKKSVRSYTKLAKALNAELVIPVSSEFVSLIAPLTPTQARIVIIPADKIDDALWNEVKFAALRYLDITGPVLICDYDIVVSSEFCEYIARVLSVNKTGIGYLCQETSFRRQRSNPNPAYEYFKHYIGDSIRLSAPCNAGMMYTDNPQYLANTFFGFKDHLSKTYGKELFNNKRIFVEGSIEQMLMPELFRKANQLFLLDGASIPIDGVTRQDICHLFGVYKKDRVALQNFVNIYRKEFGYSKQFKYSK